MAPARQKDQPAAAAAETGDTAAAPAGGTEPMVLSATGEPQPNPAAGGAPFVPYDIGGLPPPRAAGGEEETRTVRLFGQTSGEVRLSLDGGPRLVYEVTGEGTIAVPASIAPRIAAAIPGATLED